MSLAMMFADFWLSGEWGTIPPPPGSIDYLMPAGAVDVPPTHQQVAGHSRVSGVASTDGVATTMTITHNMAISAADLARDFPDVEFEPADSDFNALNLFVLSKSANAVVVQFTSGTLTSFGFRVLRPPSKTK